MPQQSASSPPARNQAFNRTPAPRVHRAVFDLSHEKKLTFDWGMLVPSLCMEMLPGDSFEFSNDIIVRFQAMLSPVMHEIGCNVHYFFVPNRLVWKKEDTSGDDWESFISGGFTGTNAAVAPRWNVSSGKHSVGSLWDYFGLPTWDVANTFSAQFPDAIVPLDFPKRCYNLIWNEYYRDETLQAEVDIETSEDVLRRSWAKDFFTSALPWQQRGLAPALPISGFSSALFGSDVPLSFGPTIAADERITADKTVGVLGNIRTPNNLFTASESQLNVWGGHLSSANTVAFSSAITFGVTDMRFAILVQRFLERNAVSGVRYTEFLQAVFGVHPRDERLQRPEYIGGVYQPVITSEVLQTSASNAQPTPQGNMAGHGLSVGRNYAGRYFADEYGYVIAMLSVMPVPAYQQGISKDWLRTSKFDWFLPEFAGLSEQPVLNQEIYLAADAHNQTIFGYQARFNEYRYQRSSVHGLFRTDLAYWHLGRVFGSRPALNSDFIQLTSAESTSLKRVAAVPSQPLLLASVGNNVRAVRPMPEFAEPGLYRV